MGHPFEMWADRITAATTDEARRALVTEARVLRARSLSDVVALRRATFTLSQLHSLLGERSEAAHEARQLLSLCQTPPAASREEIEATRGWLRSLGEHAPKVVAPPRERSWGETRRDARPARTAPPPRTPAPREPREAPAADPGRVRALAAEGRWEEALAAADGKGPAAELVRAALRLHLALAGAEPLAAAAALRDELVARLGLAARPTPADPLSDLLGRPAPTRRAERIEAIEAFAASHPERIDALAAAALRAHLAHAGPATAAPWLAGIVVRALAAGGADAEAALSELRAAGSVAAACYDEWPCSRLQRLIARAAVDGPAVTGVRRGVLARHEPEDRKIWTLRAGDRMLAVAPHAAAPYPDELARELADRLAALCPATLVLATGSGNDGLRAAARARGLHVRDRDGDDAEILAELAALQPAPAPAAPEAPAAPAAPLERLADLVVADPLDRPRIQAAIATLRRADRALRIVQNLAMTDEAVATVLEVVAATIGNDRPIPEGTTLAVRTGLGPRTREALRDPRYGGPGIDGLADVARHLADAGWEIHRVLRGPTRREIERHPALESLSAGLGGLWRLLVRHGDRKGEVWFVAELLPEGRAAVPLLLLEDFQRVVLSDGPPAAELGAGAIAWTGAPEPLQAALAGFVALAGGPGSGDAEPAVDAGA